MDLVNFSTFCCLCTVIKCVNRCGLHFLVFPKEKSSKLQSAETRGSTGSQTTESCDSSSDDDDVFSDQNQDVSIDEEDDDADGRPPRKKPLFYIADAADMAGCCTPESVTAESIIVFNSKMHKDLGVAMGTDLENRENNNTLVDQSKEFLDNEQHMPEFSDAKLDNVRVANTIGFSRELRSNVENESALVENKGIDSSKINLTVKEMESCSYVQYSPSLASENSDTMKYSETTTQQNVTRKRSNDLEKEDLSQDGTRLGQNTGIKITSTSPSIYVYDNKGDVTPPIIIELWDKDEDYTSHFQPINHLQPTSYPQSINQLQPIQQAPRLLTTKSNKLTAEFSREEREPTPFFKTENISSKDKASAGSSFLSEDYSRTEREPTPYFDAKTQQQSKIVAFPIAVPSRNTLSPETPKEFHREPTPFFENNNTRPILTSPESLNTSMHAKGTDDITSQKQNKELKNTLSLSLTVPIGSENKRDARESTPYYDEKNPYEYTHHPDHHFSEKKSLLVKQNSKEDDVPSSENPAHLPPHLQLAGSLPQTVQQVARPTLQQNLQQGITVCMPTKVYSENKANSDQSKLSRTKQGVAFLETRRPDTLVSKPLKTLEVKREPPALAIPTDKSPVLPQGSTQASASDIQLKTPIIQARDHGGISRGKAESLKTASSISGQQARSTPLPVSQVKLSSTAVVNKPVKDGAKTVNTSCKLVQDSAEAVNKSNKLAQGSADTISGKSSKSVQENSQAVNKSCKSVQDSAETVNKSTKLAQGSAETVNKSTKLAQGSAETVNKSTKLAQGSAETVNKSTKLAQGSAEAVNKPIKAPCAAAQPASGISEGHITKGQLVKRPFPPAGLPQQIIQQKSQTITPLVQSKASTSQTTESVKTLDTTLPLRPAADSVKMLKANDVITLEKAPLAKQIVLDDSPSVSQTTAARSQAGCIPTGTLLKNNAAGQETIQLCRDETTPRDVTPRQLLVSARNIYPVEIFENESSEPPPEHTETSTKKKSAASGFSNAFTAFFKSRRRSDDLKPSKSTKDKAKRNVFAKEGRRSKPRMPQTDLSEERPAQKTRQDVVLSQAIKKCSPFGPYTAEGLCFLFVLTIFCLYLDMPIEKFVCYVLAAFYTFCIMRILGFLD